MARPSVKKVRGGQIVTCVAELPHQVWRCGVVFDGTLDMLTLVDDDTRAVPGP